MMADWVERAWLGRHRLQRCLQQATTVCEQRRSLQLLV
jgi:hypothetical protein